ncbi:hypothetical protein ACXYMU_12905 [Pontibacter sp. CAU 1760]
MLIGVALHACAPSIHYLGDTYAPSQEVEVYYDQGDVRREYKVMGKMTNDQILDYDVEAVKAKMIEKAKQSGADGIVFTDLGVQKSELDGSDRLSVKAMLIKFL